jgi:hypothetical protein
VNLLRKEDFKKTFYKNILLFRNAFKVLAAGLLCEPIFQKEDNALNAPVRGYSFAELVK